MTTGENAAGTENSVSSVPVAQTRPARPMIFGLRRSALVEIALFLAVALAFDMLVLDGARYRDVQPHPFWALVLL